MGSIRQGFTIGAFSSLCPARARIAVVFPRVAAQRWATSPPRKKKKTRTVYKNEDISKGIQFALCDAIRYIKAFEVGRPPTSCKYDLAVRLRTPKNSPVIRNRLRLPFMPDMSKRICVICPSDSPAARQAIAAGASIVGEDTVLDAIKEGRIEFDRCICHKDSAKKLQQAGVGRILGPRGLMPNEKMGTITNNVGQSVRNMIGATEYKETMGVVRCAIGQLAYTPEQLQKNIREFMASIKKDIANLSDQVQKDVHEVVLSSTNSPGFSLNGEFRSEDSLPTKDLSIS